MFLLALVLFGAFWFWNQFASQILYVQYASPLSFQQHLRCAATGLRIKEVSLDSRQLGNLDTLFTTIQTKATNASAIVLSPLVPSQKEWAKQFPVPLIQLGGVGALARGEIDEGWIKAAADVTDFMQGNPLPIALLYDQKDAFAAAAAKVFQDHYTGLLEVREVGSYSFTQAQALITELNTKAVALIVVPFVSNFDWYATDESLGAVLWVVDEMLLPLLKPKQVLGVVKDDVVSTFKEVAAHRTPTTIVRSYQKGAQSSLGLRWLIR